MASGSGSACASLRLRKHHLSPPSKNPAATMQAISRQNSEAASSSGSLFVGLIAVGFAP